MSAAVGAELREEDLLKVAKCGLCGKGIGHTGLPLFWRVTVVRYGIDVNAVLRQDGLAQHIGSSMLARVMGPDEVMAKPIGEAVTSKVLYPLESEQLELPFDDAPADVQDGIINIYAVVDDTMAPHPEWQECRVDNNVGVSGGKCLVAN